MQGNVEHFSICSEDSIWHENELSERFQSSNNINKKFNDFYSYEENYHKNSSSDRCYTDGPHVNNNNNEEVSQQCFYISSTTSENELEQNPFSQHVNKYKNHIMEKYLRDCQKPENQFNEENYEDKPSMISKWLESAANFKPSEKNYLNWTFNKTQHKKLKKNDLINYQQQQQQHGREELDAAEALTKLANAYNSRKLQLQINKI